MVFAIKKGWFRFVTKSHWEGVNQGGLIEGGPVRNHDNYTDFQDIQKHVSQKQGIVLFWLISLVFYLSLQFVIIGVRAKFLE